jgi:hypothetical protein
MVLESFRWTSRTTEFGCETQLSYRGLVLWSFSISSKRRHRGWLFGHVRHVTCWISQIKKGVLICDDMCLKHLKTLKYEMIPNGFSLGGWHPLNHASSCLRFGNPPAELFRETPGPKLSHWIQRSYMDELADLHGFGCGSTLMQFMYAPEGSIDSLLSLLSFNILHFYSVKLLWHHIPCKKT